MITSAKPTKNVKGKSRVTSQLHAQPTKHYIYGGSTDQLSRMNQSYPGSKYQSLDWYKKVRAMRCDATIALLRELLIAPIQASTWSVELSDNGSEEQKEFLESCLLPLKTDFVRSAMRGMLDFGWAPFEKIWRYKDGKYRLDRLKPLLQDVTEVTLFDESDTKHDAGAFSGYHQEGGLIGNEFKHLALQYSLLINWDVEGDYHYGIPMMAPCERPYDEGLEVAASAKRYDKKIAGAHWVFWYPEGEMVRYGDEDIPAEQALEKIFKSIESSGMMGLPNRLNTFVSELDGKSQGHKSWDVQLMSADSSSNEYFIKRMGYIDKQKARALVFPERTVFEGEHGTKAEAGEHGGFAIYGVESKNIHMIDQLNKRLVCDMSFLNFGEDSIEDAKLNVLPIANELRGILKGIYTAAINHPEAFQREQLALDWANIRDGLGLPVSSLSEDDITKQMEETKAAKQEEELAKTQAKQAEVIEKEGEAVQKFGEKVKEKVGKSSKE